jgi:predicted secreted hydrolase
VALQVATTAGSWLVEELLDALELDSRASTGTIYWEGLSDLREADSGKLRGRGYLEMTGYAQRLKL